MKRTVRYILLFLSVVTLLHAQEPLAPMAPDAKPGFEVATIKPCDPNSRNSGFHLNGRSVFIECKTVDNLIMFAYAVHVDQIVGAPAWFASQRLDVRGAPDAPGVPNVNQYRTMVQKLLVERFGLAFHHDKRELSVYEITVAKRGSKLTKSAHSPDDPPDQTGNGQGNLRCTNTSMPEFVLNMQFYLDKPVINATGLDGRYDFTLHWSPELSTNTDPNAPPGLFTAMEEQLGLKIAPEKRPIDVLVIDHATQPSAN